MGFDQKAFVTRLENAAKRSGKSGEEIQVACGFSWDFWRCALRGIVTLSAAQIFNLCVCLDVSADWLLGLKALREAKE